MKPIPQLDYLGPLILACGVFFHHSNARLPLRVERWLNRVVVTPRMHGTHHSIVRRETDSNWGTIFSWWDRLHRSLRADVPQDAITIGVPAWRDERELTVGDLLLIRFAGSATGGCQAAKCPSAIRSRRVNWRRETVMREALLSFWLLASSPPLEERAKYAALVREIKRRTTQP